MLETNKFFALLIFAEKETAQEVKTTLSKCTRLTARAVHSNYYDILHLISNGGYDLVMMDVTFSTLTAFEILKRCEKQPPVIFFSHKKKWATKAFYYGAIDYIVYPLRPERVFRAVNRYLELVDAIASQAVLNRRLIIEQRGTQIHLNPREAVCAVSNGKKSVIYTRNDRFEVGIMLKDLDEMLQKLGFVRLHKRYLVNRRFIKSLNQSGERDKVARIDHPEIEYVPVGRSYYKKLDPDEFSTSL